MKKDPSLQGGFVQIYQKEVQTLIKSQSLSFSDQVMVRIFKNTQGYKLQLTSQSNTSFFYSLFVSHKELPQIIESKVQDQTAWLKDIFSGNHKYQLIVYSAEQAKLVIEQLQKYKNYELASFDFEMGPQELIRESLMYRYQRMKIRQNMLDVYWQNMCSVIKAKNPSILLQLEHKYKRNAFR